MDGDGGVDGGGGEVVMIVKYDQVAILDIPQFGGVNKK